MYALREFFTLLSALQLPPIIYRLLLFPSFPSPCIAQLYYGEHYQYQPAICLALLLSPKMVKALPYLVLQLMPDQVELSSKHLH